MTHPQIDLIPLRAAVCSDQPITLDVLVRVIPPDLPPTLAQQRPTLNLGFVIDRSGSMNSARKIDYARKAVCYAIEQLLPSDRLSVTIFDDRIETLIPNTPANNKASFLRLINQIEPGGSTALHGGWVQGGIQTSQHLNADLNRVILLSDGLANVGETNPDAIASDVHGLAQRGVSTSTLGLGNDYNEDLLEAMARSGDGNYYYVESADQLPGIFEQELQGLSTTIGKSVTLAFQPQGEVVVADVLNDLDVDADGRFKLPNLLFSTPIEVVVRFKIPAIAQATDLCHIHLNWLDNEQHPHTQQVTLRLPVVPKIEFDTIAQNADVEQQVALMMTARAKREAIRLVDRGEYDGASQVLQTAKRFMLHCEVPLSAPEAAALEDLDQELKSRSVTSYRKRAGHQAYARTRGRSSGHASLFYAFDRGPQLGDITQQAVDAIVNSTDEHFSDSGAISQAIHRAAGPKLRQACAQFGYGVPGQAYITPGFNLPAQQILHTICLSWPIDPKKAELTLMMCYRQCLELAAQADIQSIAFPPLGIGGHRFPPEKAAEIAFRTVGEVLQRSTAIGTVRFICPDETTLQYYQAAFKQVEAW